jgi:transcriptional regulator with XRE-family HTH domain
MAQPQPHAPPAANAAPRSFGEHLRAWRQRRRLTQLDLALEAEVSARHLSFLETGRAKPSREMILQLAESLVIPLRERNVVMVAAGFAPVFGERPLADPAMAEARAAIDLILAGHEPYPAIAVDRHWMLAAANKAAYRLLAGVQPTLLAPPVNVLRLSLHPEGLAARIVNLSEWRAHILARLRQQVEATADARLAELHAELAALPRPASDRPPPRVPDRLPLVLPLRLSVGDRVLAFISTTTVFGTPVDVTLSELAIESFFPADAETAEALRQMATQTPSPALAGEGGRGAAG